MGTPKRIDRYTGRHALVDGIPFTMPVVCRNSPAFIAVFPVNYTKAQELLPGNEVHPLRLWKKDKALLVVTVIDYRDTVIGKYIEYSIAIACTYGKKPAPRLLPGLLMKRYGTGQFVVDLPVSSEISVKGGKGIWGMPKHQGNLNFIIGQNTVSSQYDLDGQLVTYVEIERPRKSNFSSSFGAANYCAFRGMLMKSRIYFKGKMGFVLGRRAKARFILGDHTRAAPLKALEIAPEPIATVFIPSANGTLDDYLETWFLTEPVPPAEPIQGMESVNDLGLSEEWLDQPFAPVPGVTGGRT